MIFCRKKMGSLLLYIDIYIYIYLHIPCCIQTISGGNGFDGFVSKLIIFEAGVQTPVWSIESIPNPWINGVHARPQLRFANYPSPHFAGWCKWIKGTNSMYALSANRPPLHATRCHNVRGARSEASLSGKPALIIFAWSMVSLQQLIYYFGRRQRSLFAKKYVKHTCNFLRVGKVPKGLRVLDRIHEGCRNLMKLSGATWPSRVDKLK